MTDPLQFHYVVYGEKTENGIQWTLTIDPSFLDDGSVFDPSQPWGLGWRPVDTENPEEAEIDDLLVQELERRLNARVIL